MAQIYQVRCTWTGVPGGGVSTFYLDPAQAAAGLANLNTFWDIVRTYLPSTVVVTVPAEGESYDDVTGIPGGGWAIGTATSHTGQATGTYSAPSGAVITWLTGQVVGRRRLKGRTFLVPLGAIAYQSDGTLDAGVLVALRSAAAGLITASGDFLFKVWHRPTPTSPTGVSALIQGSSVPDMAAVLRSRRD